jgi:broad specificity phosphatase PhoE
VAEPTVLLLRHAETEWSVAHRHTGRTDIPLTDEGRARAQALAPLLRGRRFALVLSSPLSRARETARLAGLPEPELDDDLLEWDYGEAEGRTAADVREERPGWVLWRDGAPGGESPDDVAVRADRVIERLLSTGGDICVVAHGHMLRMLAGRWLEEGPAFGQRLPLAAGHLAVLGFERAARVLRGWGLPQPPT